MKNMFSGKSEIKIPKTLNECIKPDATVTNLHVWSERVENLGKMLFRILIVAGIIMSIIMLVQNDHDEFVAFSSAFSTLATWALYAFIEYCSYHIIALLISSLASITQSTLITANITLYKASLNDADSTKQSTDEPTETVDTVVKSAPIIDNKKPVSHAHATPSPTADRMWTCKNCGTLNKYEYGMCKKCAQYRSQ